MSFGGQDSVEVKEIVLLKGEEGDWEEVERMPLV